ncbi:hypothetical protein Y032_0140g2168 [Ancylostoma ceylanicum]|uniref:Uncharacterized protein n=1 Tax=Ancylostoma ceylanicum TaxID=53326 RepID=A0A016T4G6_9BILA|nr:hypothetical protein Y032_0140g2168 [Ancylostoma ceylanicum]
MGGRKRSELLAGSIPYCCQNGNFRRADSSPTQPLLGGRRFSSVDGVRSFNDRYNDRYSPFKRKSFKKRTEEFLNGLGTNECKDLLRFWTVFSFLPDFYVFPLYGRFFLEVLLVKCRVHLVGGVW